MKLSIFLFFLIFFVFLTLLLPRPHPHTEEDNFEAPNSNTGRGKNQNQTTISVISNLSVVIVLSYSAFCISHNFQHLHQTALGGFVVRKCVTKRRRKEHFGVAFCLFVPNVPHVVFQHDRPSRHSPNVSRNANLKPLLKRQKKKNLFLRLTSPMDSNTITSNKPNVLPITIASPIMLSSVIPCVNEMYTTRATPATAYKA